jgi:hypothetical protein
VRRVLAVGVLTVAIGGVLCASAFPARSAAAGKSVTITVRLIQEATYQYPHGIPTMPGGLVLSTQLRLYAVGTVLGFPSNTFLGTMSFTYQLHGTCSSGGSGCTGTTNLDTLTKFPGGTITADGPKISLATGLTVPITKGTGIFKGVTGTIDIAPNGQANSVYKLVLPSS